jgi:hypothetical protein
MRTAYREEDVWELWRSISFEAKVDWRRIARDLERTRGSVAMLERLYV